jgi:phage repressor protein C with HTH and peptisase S24 domain
MSSHKFQFEVFFMKKHGRAREKTEGLAGRLKTAISARGTLEACAIATGIPYSTLHKYLLGINEPSVSALKILANYTDRSPTYLVIGEDRELQKAVEYIKYFKAEAGAQHASDLIMVPVYPIRAAAGRGTEVFTEESSHKIAFRTAWLKKYGVALERPSGVYVDGNSMEPVLSDGDLVVVNLGDRDWRRAGDAVWLIRYDGAPQLKRLVADGAAGLQMVSINPAYRPTPVEPSSQVDFEVLGRVIWAAREL